MVVLVFGLVIFRPACLGGLCYILYSACCSCLKKNHNTPRPSEHPPVMGRVVVCCRTRSNDVGFEFEVGLMFWG